MLFVLDLLTIVLVCVVLIAEVHYLITTLLHLTPPVVRLIVLLFSVLCLLITIGLLAGLLPPVLPWQRYDRGS